MKFEEFGNKSNEAILLLHGGGLSWWNYRAEAQMLESNYHIILPVLDGHSGSDNAFHSIGENAQEIIDFIDRHLGGRVLLMGGLSLGGQVLLEILSRRADICKYAMIESALAVPSNLQRVLIAPALHMSYGLIRQKWFSRLQFKALHIKNALFPDYYRDSCNISKENMIAFLAASLSYSPKPALAHCKAGVHIFVGAKERREILRSAEKIQRMIPGSKYTVLPDKRHGEFSINDADAYVQALLNIIIA